MTELDDHALLADFARSESDEAFATLVARHVNLVYSAALRFTANPHHAQEITQAVFIILARKAKSLSRKTILSGWLYQTARLTAANFVRGEIRRQQREQEAYMQSTVNEPGPAAWEQIAPLLDEAMGCLGETDRNAVVLRFFENRTAQEVGKAMKLTEAAAHKRTARALEKLRTFFSKRGVTLTATVIAGTVATNSVQAAPLGLVSVIAGMAAGGSAISVTTFTLVKGTLKLMAWTKVKTAMVVTAVVVLAAGTTTVGLVAIQPTSLLPIQALPDPNGYDTLMKAGEMTAPNNLDFDRATIGQLRSATAANLQALHLARIGLDIECRVPLQYSEAYASTHIDDLSKIKKLAQAFLAEGKLAEKESRTADAAKSFLDAVRLGGKAASGGVLIDYLVGIACEAMGATGLQGLVGTLDPASCLEAAAVLARFDSQKPTWDEIVRQEQDWSLRVFTGIHYKIFRIIKPDFSEQTFRMPRQKVEAQRLKTRQLMIRLAARAYLLNQGHPPAGMADLVPYYLQSIPKDPRTGLEMDIMLE